MVKARQISPRTSESERDRRERVKRELVSTIILIHPRALILETRVASADGLVCRRCREDEESEAEREERDPSGAENITENVRERVKKECVHAERGHVHGQAESFAVCLGAIGHDRGVGDEATTRAECRKSRFGRRARLSAQHQAPKQSDPGLDAVNGRGRSHRWQFHKHPAHLEERSCFFHSPIWIAYGPQQ
jgi:hypothetical protein